MEIQIIMVRLNTARIRTGFPTLTELGGELTLAICTNLQESRSTTGIETV